MRWLDSGGTFSQAFSTPGTFGYSCEFHGAAGGIGMSGAVTVQGAAAPVVAAAPATVTAPQAAAQPAAAQPAGGAGAPAAGTARTETVARDIPNPAMDAPPSLGVAGLGALVGALGALALANVVSARRMRRQIAG
ncbi:MAG: hypothetical protein ABR509_02925 [Candidatus Limnocylindria bacterium]